MPGKVRGSRVSVQALAGYRCQTLRSYPPGSRCRPQQLGRAVANTGGGLNEYYTKLFWNPLAYELRSFFYQPLVSPRLENSPPLTTHWVYEAAEPLYARWQAIREIVLDSFECGLITPFFVGTYNRSFPNIVTGIFDLLHYLAPPSVGTIHVLNENRMCMWRVLASSQSKIMKASATSCTGTSTM